MVAPSSLAPQRCLNAGGCGANPGMGLYQRDEDAPAFPAILKLSTTRENQRSTSTLVSVRLRWEWENRGACLRCCAVQGVGNGRRRAGLEMKARALGQPREPPESEPTHAKNRAMLVSRLEHSQAFSISYDVPLTCAHIKPTISHGTRASTRWMKAQTRADETALSFLISMAALFSRLGRTSAS